MQGGDQVVVFFAGFVVEEDAFLDGFLDDGVCDVMRFCRLRERGGYLQDVLGAAGVAAGVRRDFFQGFIGGFEVQ